MLCLPQPLARPQSPPRLPLEQMKPRVLNIVADGKPGGGTTIVLGLCADTQTSGQWDVALATDTDSYAAAKARELGIPVFDVPFFGLRYAVEALVALRRIVSGFRPDVIHVHGCRAGLPVAVLKLIGTTAPLVYTVHGFHFVKRKPLARWLGRHSERLVTRVVDRLVFVSEGDRAIAFKYGLIGGKRGEGSSRTIYNGVDTGAIDLLTNQTEKAFDLVFAARLVRQKNPTFVIEILGKLRHSGVRLLVVGGGELEAECRHLAEKYGVSGNVRFAGQLDHAATIRAIASAQLCILPSLWEGLPVTLIEASYLGVPVIGSDIPGNDEVVVKGKTGILIPGFDAKQYADAIQRLLGDRSLLQRFATLGRSRVSEQFTRARCSGQYFDVYRSIHVPVRAN